MGSKSHANSASGKSCCNKTRKISDADFVILLEGELSLELHPFAPLSERDLPDLLLLVKEGRGSDAGVSALYSIASFLSSAFRTPYYDYYVQELRSCNLKDRLFVACGVVYTTKRKTRNRPCSTDF